jgi:uncharacterized protein
VQQIPIFALGHVLFPRSLLPLRVFETRYMDMVKDCLRSEQPFGVCLISEGQEVGAAASIHPVGCLARIVEWDMPELGILHVVAEGLVRLLRAIVENSDEKYFPRPLRFEDAVWVGHRLADVLPIPSGRKQQALALEDPVERLALLHSYVLEQRGR